MDPNACLDLIAFYLRYADDYGADLDETCQDLFDWLDKGGFEPDWSKHPSASEYYRCRAVHHRTGKRV